MIDTRTIKPGDKLKINVELTGLPIGSEIIVEQVDDYLEIIWFTNNFTNDFGYLHKSHFDYCWQLL